MGHSLWYVSSTRPQGGQQRGAPHALRHSLEREVANARALERRAEPEGTTRSPPRQPHPRSLSSRLNAALFRRLAAVAAAVQILLGLIAVVRDDYGVQRRGLHRPRRGLHAPFAPVWVRSRALFKSNRGA